MARLPLPLIGVGWLCLHQYLTWWTTLHASEITSRSVWVVCAVSGAAPEVLSVVTGASVGIGAVKENLFAIHSDCHHRGVCWCQSSRHYPQKQQDDSQATKIVQQHGDLFSFKCGHLPCPFCCFVWYPRFLVERSWCLSPAPKRGTSVHRWGRLVAA